MQSEVQNDFKPLTRYKVGSLGEMSSLALPLMLSALSGALMLFFDRYILAHYSLLAFNTAATAGISVMIFHLGGIGIAGICEIYVGQSNGSKAYKKIGSHVWQMLWFSLFTSLIFVPLSFTQSWFLPERYTEEGKAYFQWLMLIGPVITANAALCGFYIGRGKVKLLTAAVILGNLINIALDIAFVFGFGFIPSMGTVGAAYATCIASLIQFSILLGVFLSKSSRNDFATNDYVFKIKDFVRAFKVGFPASAGHMIEIAAWSMQFHLLALVSDMHVAVLAIGQTFFILVAFTTEGLRGGVVACASNLVGAKKYEMVKPTFISALKLHLFIGIIFVIPLLLFPEWIINDFLKSQEGNFAYNELLMFSKMACGYIIIYYLFDGIVWTCAGFLTAIEDTFFIMIINALNAWLFGLLPMYYLINIKGGSPDKAWMVIAIYGLANMICFSLRNKHKYKRLMIQSKFQARSTISST